MDQETALDLLFSAADRGDPQIITTHQLAEALLALPPSNMKLVDEQGGPESWSGRLAEEDVQVAIRTF